MVVVVVGLVDDNGGKVHLKNMMDFKYVLLDQLLWLMLLICIYICIYLANQVLLLLLVCKKYHPLNIDNLSKTLKRSYATINFVSL